MRRYLPGVRIVGEFSSVLMFLGEEKISPELEEQISADLAKDAFRFPDLQNLFLSAKESTVGSVVSEEFTSALLEL
jgi:hypothetical protein